jgi:hypothetical protein
METKSTKTNEDKRLFVPCSSCNRPYIKGESYPKEVCGVCDNMGIVFNDKKGSKNE